MRPIRFTFAAAVSLLLAACAAPLAQTTLAETPAASANINADLVSLVDGIQLDYESFTLPNGLVTIVHTDRKAPVVGVTLYYRVGAKHEPRGRTGFAHLFEHLMFGGSENVAEFDALLESAGSTITNGSTSYDRTNYVVTVPTGALDLALFAESDRMGHLLGAVTQEKLDNQRGVVQNEKRQRDNNPYGLVNYVVNSELFPVGHPYRHSIIGSMADLDAASLEDVRNWFTSNYAPNNVVLALTGDIDAATARPMVERWFGDIPSGPKVTLAPAGPVTLDAPVYREIADQVPATRIYRYWTGPGMNDPDALPLEVGIHILGGLASSRLDNELVRGKEVATRVVGYYASYEQVGFANAYMDIAPGKDRPQAESDFYAVIDRMVSEGPTADEMRRAATQMIANPVKGMEQVGQFGGKGAVLAEGQLYTGDPHFEIERLKRLATLTPEEVHAAMQRWLTRPPLTLAVVPGTRTLDGGPMGGWGDEATVPPPAPDAGGGVAQPQTQAQDGQARTAPAVAPVGDLELPAIQTKTLSNGIEVTLARRSAIPALSLSMVFDAGSSADAPGEAGRHEMMMDMLSEGTTTRSAQDIAAEAESLGASLTANSGIDTSTVSLDALTVNLGPSLELMADVVRNPAFADGDFARLKAQRLARIEQERASPGPLAIRALYPTLFGADHPYAHAASSGNPTVIAELTPADMRAEHDSWIRPGKARINAVGDVTMNELVAALEAVFGNWQPPEAAPATKHMDAPIPPQKSHLVVVDRPNSPSSYIVMGRVLPLTGVEGSAEDLQLANEVLGSGFLSRLMDDLRETKGWTYGIYSYMPTRIGPRPFLIASQVQADRTGDSIRAIIDIMKAYPANAPVTPAELQRVTDGNIRALPIGFETNDQVLGTIAANQLLGRPADYPERLPEIYRAITAQQIEAAAAEYLQPDGMTIVVVGDRELIDEQLASTGMEVGYLDADEL